MKKLTQRLSEFTIPKNQDVGGKLNGRNRRKRGKINDSSGKNVTKNKPFRDS